MTSEATVPEAAIDAACAAFFDECEKAADLDWLSLQQGHVEIRGAFSKDALFRAALTAALPHLSTAIRDAALGEPIKLAIPVAPPFTYRDLTDFKWLPVAVTDMTGVSDYVVMLPSGREHFIAKEDYEALQPMSAPAAPAQAPGELAAELTRPIIGIENRSAQEAFNIMADRIRHALAATPVHQEAWE